MTVFKMRDIYVNRSKLKEWKAIVLLKDNDQWREKLMIQKQFWQSPGKGMLIKNDTYPSSSNFWCPTVYN